MTLKTASDWFSLPAGRVDLTEPGWRLCVELEIPEVVVGDGEILISMVCDLYMRVCNV